MKAAVNDCISTTTTWIAKKKSFDVAFLMACWKHNPLHWYLHVFKSEAAVSTKWANIRERGEEILTHQLDWTTRPNP